MKITSEDQNQLIIKHSGLPAVIIGFLFAGLGIFFFYLSFSSNQFPWWSGILFILCSIPAIIFPANESILFDKEKNLLRIDQKNMLKKSSKEYKLRDINEIQWLIRANTNGGKGWIYLIGCQMNNGDTVLLNESHPASGTAVSFGMMSWRFTPGKKIAERIATFLGLQLKEMQPPTIDEIIGKISDQIKDFNNK